MAIKKAEIQITVLFHDQEVAPVLFEDGSFANVECEIGRGSCLMGRSKVLSIQDVPAEKLKEEQLALGNDGSFFSTAAAEGPQP